MLLATINSGTLIIALPDLERSLHTSLLELVWVILVYMIASTVLVLSAGRLSDQFGRKQAYIGALFITAVLVWQITGDGEATPFEGVALIATYVILATVAAFE